MIAHNKPTVSAADLQALAQPVNNGWLAEGKQVAAFEQEFCDLYDLPSGHAVAVSSGSAALYLALQALNAKAKIVAIPCYSCASLENAVQLAQAKPYYVDTEVDSFNMQQAELAGADAIIYPHLFGMPGIINTTLKSKVIEDCAQAIGARIQGELAGLQGELGIFSFYATKLMTSAGQGGMVIAKNKAYIDFIKDFIHFDCKNDGLLRFNMQMTDLQAAMGRGQLQQLFAHFIPKRAAIYQSYKDTELPFVDVADQSIKPVRFRALLRTNKPDQLAEFMLQRGIKTIIPIAEHELLGGANKVNALRHSQSFLSIPCYPSLKDDELQHIISSLKSAKHLI